MVVSCRSTSEIGARDLSMVATAPILASRYGDLTVDENLFA
jgi:hypothetical protein